MATFPLQSKISRSTNPQVDSGRRVRLSEGGNVHGRNAYGTNAVYRFDIEYVQLTDAERTTLDSFYTTNSAILNAVTIDTVTYAVLFTNKPMTIEKYGPLRNMSCSVLGHVQ